MGIAAPKEENIVEFTLDVAFDSSVGEPDPHKPTAMTRRFGLDRDGKWEALGDTRLTVNQYSSIRLGVFDTGGSDPAELVQIVIDFDPPSQTKAAWSPFGDDPVIAIAPGSPSLHQLDPPIESEVLNLDAKAGWVVGPFQALNTGTFRGNVTVYLAMKDGTKKIFTTDPEMIVEGAGPVEGRPE
jgi:hypothetical protein